MIVIKPIKIDDSNLTSSTIPEPDTSTGEVEWATKSFISAISGLQFWLDFDGVNFWSLEFLGDTLHEYDIYFNELNSYSTGLSNQGLAYANEKLYIADSSTNTIIEFGLDGVPTGFSFSIASQTTSYASITYDGNFINVFPLSPGDQVHQYFLDGRYNTAWTMPVVFDVIGACVIDNVFYLNDTNGKKIEKVSALDYSSIGDFTTSNQGEDSFGVATRGGFLFVIVINGVNSDIYQYTTIGEIKGSFIEGDEVIKSSTHKRYIAAVNTNDDPEIGVALIPPSWVEVSPTNRYSMFDNVVGTQSTGDLSEIIEVTPSEIIGGLAVINMTGVSAVNVMMTDPTDGVVYNRDIDMVDNGNIVDWFSYLWGEFNLKTEFIILDLPPYSEATIKLTFTGVADIGIGVVKMGPVVTLGTTNYGTNVQQLDLNIYKFDSFGNETVIKRPHAKLVNFKNTVEKANLTYVYRQLEELRGVSAVYVGDETGENDLTLVYGTHRDNTLNIDSPTACTVPLQIRGAV